MHTYIHTYTQTYMHTYIHAYIHTYSTLLYSTLLCSTLLYSTLLNSTAAVAAMPQHKLNAITPLNSNAITATLAHLLLTHQRTT